MRNEKKHLIIIDWRFKIAIFLLFMILLTLLIAFILLLKVLFINSKGETVGNGFWAVKKYGIKNFFQNLKCLNELALQAGGYQFAPFTSVFVATLLLIVVVPLMFVIMIYFLIRGWIKTRI